MRPCVLGNGSLYVGLDQGCCVRELFWPVTGLENHSAPNRRNRIFVWRGNEVLPLDEDNWDIQGGYGQGMTYGWQARRHDLALSVDDAVDPYTPVWTRRVRLLLPHPEPLGIFFVQSYNLLENSVGECAFWDEGAKRLYHYKGPVWVAIEIDPKESSQGAVNKVRDGGAGINPGSPEVSGRVVDHGLVESVVGAASYGSGEVSLRYSLAMGPTRQEADRALDEGRRGVFGRSRTYWQVNGFENRFPGGTKGLPEELGRFADLSLRILSTHCDRGGGVIASCDTDIMTDYGDHYRYVWPRDAAMCASSLIFAGHPGFGKRYLEFCSQAQDTQGFLWQRYRPDGTRGSGWYAPTVGGPLPLQEDETALSLLTAGDYLQETGDLRFLYEIYPFLEKGGDFLLSYTEAGGTLVKPSFDLWEERSGAFAFTQAACVAGLAACSKISLCLGKDKTEAFSQGCFSLLLGLTQHLSNDKDGFMRGLSAGGEDWTPDASLFALPLLLDRAGDLMGEVLEVEGPDRKDRFGDLRRLLVARSRRTWERLRGELTFSLPGIGLGVARYPGDWYFREQGTEGPGNAWPVALAWYLLSGHRLGVLGYDSLKEGCEWMMRMRGPGGVLAEQYYASSGSLASVAPLAWSHGAYLDLVVCLLTVGARCGMV